MNVGLVWCIALWVRYVRRTGAFTPAHASVELGKHCTCNVFNREVGGLHNDER